ncbi:hypothetical protein [Nocardia wallacei]|uniref:hypothetical protein n=1 Tax=Nocardia wallacei TaxID=480035 RepID=UPI0024565DF6|nr:hypothetical protein [Nocardia wallacei]
MINPPAPATSWTSRTGAALALLSATLHAACDGTHCATVWSVVLPALMSLGCLWCGWHLWTRPSPAAWAMTAAMSTAMLTLHYLAPMPGALMHGAFLAALAETALSGAVLLRNHLTGRRPQSDAQCSTP